MEPFFQLLQLLQSWKVTGVLLGAVGALSSSFGVPAVSQSDLPTFFCACLRAHKWPHIPNSFSVTGTWYKTKLSDKISLQQTLYHELSVCTERKIPNQSKFSFKEAKISSHWEKFSCQMLALQLWPSWLGSYLKQGCNDFFFFHYGKTCFHFSWMAEMLMLKRSFKSMFRQKLRSGNFKRKVIIGMNWK